MKNRSVRANRAHRTKRVGAAGLCGLLIASTTPACLGGGEFLSTTLVATTSPEDDSSTDDTSSSLLITGAVLLGISIAATIVVFTTDDGDDFSYLRAHQQDVRVALARGDGPFVTDLGHSLALGAPLLPHLGAVLRDARPALEPSVANGPIDKEGAQAFAKELVRALSDDPILSPYLDHVLSLAATGT